LNLHDALILVTALAPHQALLFEPLEQGGSVLVLSRARSPMCDTGQGALSQRIISTMYCG
jgi:hypothetical protein